jgi:hypothetical protein
VAAPDWIIALGLAAVPAVSPANAGIDEPFHKKNPGPWTWGEILEWATGSKGFARSLALVIGISDYEHFEDLETTSGNYLRVKDHLINEAGFNYVHVLTEEKVALPGLLLLETLRSGLVSISRFGSAEPSACHLNRRRCCCHLLPIARTIAFVGLLPSATETAMRRLAS